LERHGLKDRILITGANGFIGSNLCRYFLGEGFEVYGLVRRTSDLHFLEGKPVKLLFGDLLEPKAINLPEPIDYVVHAASLTSDLAPDSECEPGIYQVSVNLVRKLEKLRTRPKRIIHISTALTLGYSRENISEENPGRSVEFLPYTRAKIKTEAFLFEQARNGGLPVVILRPGDVFGPNDRTSGGKIMRGCERKFPLIVGRGNWRLSFCYIDNLCQAAHLALLKPGIEGRAYAVTNREAVTWRKLFSGMQKGLNRKQRVYVPVAAGYLLAAFQELTRRIVPGFSPEVTFYRIKRVTRDTSYDISRTIAELGYQPDDDIDGQIQAIVSWYLEEKRKGYIK
jgi:nucleoside-diphosphate-sugar epimerase